MGLPAWTFERLLWAQSREPPEGRKELLGEVTSPPRTTGDPAQKGLASPIPGANQLLVEKVGGWGGSTSQNPAFPNSKDRKTKESLKMTLYA